MKGKQRIRQDGFVITVASGDYIGILPSCMAERSLSRSLGVEVTIAAGTAYALEADRARSETSGFHVMSLRFAPHPPG